MKKNRSKIVLLVVLAFIGALTPLPLIKPSVDESQPLQEPSPKTADTLVAIALPDDDIQTTWITATPHWNKLNECDDESDPPDDVYVIATSDYHGEIEKFRIDNSIQQVGLVSEIKIHTYGASTGDSNPKVSIYWNGDWTEWQTVNLPRNPFPGLPTPDWFVNTFEVEGTQSDVNNLKVQYQAQCTGWFYIPPFSFPIGSNNLDAFFCEVIYEPTTEITESCRPNNDGYINEWLFYPQPHWSRLNEEVINPQPGDDIGIFANFDYNGDIEEFKMDDSIEFVGTVSKIEVHTYGGSSGDTNPKVRIFWNNTWSDWQTVNLPRQPTPGPPLTGWATNTFTFVGNQADVDNLKVQYQAQCTGWFYIPPFSFPIGSNFIYTSYCDITFTQGISLISPRPDKDYTEYVMLDISPDTLTQIEYNLFNGNGWQSISGDTALHIPEGEDHSIQVRGYYDTTQYYSDIVEFSTWNVTNSNAQGLDWGVDQINAESCWDLTTGDDIKVLVIDTGMDLDHDDLADNYELGEDFEHEDNYPEDTEGHGTNCAGIIGAINNEIGIIGASPEVSLYIAQIYTWSTMDFITQLGSAIQWGIDNEVDVISMSLGYFTNEIINYNVWADEVEEKCQAAYQAGITLCVASGNWNSWGDSITDIHYPAAFYDYVIPVGALYYDLTLVGSDTYNRWTISGYPEEEYYGGSCYGYDQGYGVVTAGTQITSTDLDNGYYTGNGTSYACPLVAGVCALILAASSEIYQMTGSDRPEAVRECIYNTAIDLGASGWDQYYGNGMVDATKAIDYALANFY
ncbi:MAG: S8 family serine peptidase [Promethearchaeota archaeon]